MRGNSFAYDIWYRGRKYEIYRGYREITVNCFVGINDKEVVMHTKQILARYKKFPYYSFYKRNGTAETLIFHARIPRLKKRGFS